MEVEFRATAEDYRGFVKYHSFGRYLGLRITFVALFSFLMESPIVSRHFSWGPYLFDSLILSIILFFCLTGIPYIINLRKTRKELKRVGDAELHLRIELTADGFLVQPVVAETEPEQEKKFWRWQAIKYTGCNSKYVFIVMIPGGVFVIPKSSFHSAEEANHFVFILEAGMETVWGSKPKRAQKLYIWGLLGLIPTFGAIAGVILLFKGIFQFKDKILILIGASGIMFTIAFWWVGTTVISKAGVFNGKIFNTQQVQTTRGELNTIYRYIEFYKIQHGVYPDSLEQLDLINDDFIIGVQLESWGNNKKPPYFYYQKIGGKYWLFSVGPDGKPFTADDIYPVMNPADSAKFGIMKKFVH